MRDISMHILDIAQNSIKAGAGIICIDVTIDEQGDLLEVSVEDNGSGMSRQMLQSAASPFATTRKERNVGLGIPLFAASCERTGESLKIESHPGEGTKLHARYRFSHIDRPPLGDIAQTLYALSVMNPQLDFVLRAKKVTQFCYDTRQIKETLDGVPMDAQGVQEFINDYLSEGITDIFGGKDI